MTSDLKYIQHCFNFLFYIGMWPINSVVVFLGGRRRGSASNIRVPVLF